MNEIDLGPCRGRVYDLRSDDWAIVLPGANYPPDAPLLWFAREALLSSNRSVLAVYDSIDRRADPQEWVEERFEAALNWIEHDERPMVVAKSLTTLAAPMAAERGLPAVWLTPLINHASTSHASTVLDGLRAANVPCVLVGGTADPSWDRSIADRVSTAKVIEIRDANHALQVEGDIGRSVAALGVVADAVSDFAGGLAP